MEKKQIAIVGAGVAGLLACKYCLSKGFNPIVFDFESDIGGVWAKTIKTTRLQVPKTMYQFSDFPWPASVTNDFPTQQEMIDYIRSYATHFKLMSHINFNSRVKGIDYDGPSSDKWSLWNGTGEAFPPEAGKWHVTVENTKTTTTQVYTVDFVILCVGRFKDVPKIPQFPEGKGPEVFRGKAIHSMEFAAMDHDKAEEFVKGKKVVVVGFGKSGLDIARECASINGPKHPCSIVYKRDHWKLPGWFAWGIPLVDIIFSRITMLSVHKPGEGFLLGLLATLFSPVRWGVWKLVESYAKWTIPISKHDMVPQHSLEKDVSSGLVLHMPNAHDFFDAVDKGSIHLKKSPSFEFYEKGVFFGHDNTRIEADVVIYATGFNGVDKLADMFESKTFRHYIADSPRVPLYRESIHTRIPQLAVVGFSDGLSSLYTSEMSSRWLMALLEGAVKLPSIKEMQEDINRWDEYMKRASGEYHTRSVLGGIEIWYNDLVCKDMGMNPMRKKGLLANLFEAYAPNDYVEI